MQKIKITINGRQEILPGIPLWAQINIVTIDKCDQQLEKMLRKFDVEQNKVILKKSKLTTIAEREEVKWDFRIEK